MSPIELNKKNWVLKGNITFNEILFLMNKTKNHNWNENITLDLSQVKNIDTSLLGLLFEWKRQAKENKYLFNINKVPKNLTKLAQLYGVKEFL
jgi:ABC-type transporter Mla MlaB component|tara:strand:- start:762 stop:1040 length:279 start_codon:yes stop_codon:yes gene_type:complete